jgi:hypothetical protein
MAKGDGSQNSESIAFVKASRKCFKVTSAVEAFLVKIRRIFQCFSAVERKFEGSRRFDESSRVPRSLQFEYREIHLDLFHTVRYCENG